MQYKGMGFLFIYAGYINVVIYDTAPTDISILLTMHFPRKANPSNVTASLFEFLRIIFFYLSTSINVISHYNDVIISPMASQSLAFPLFA